MGNGQIIGGGKGIGQSVFVPPGTGGGANGSLAVHNLLPIKSQVFAIGGAPGYFDVCICAEITTLAANSQLWILASWNGYWVGAAANLFWQLVVDDAVIKDGVSPSLSNDQRSSSFFSALTTVTAGLHRVGLRWNKAAGGDYFIIDPSQNDSLVQTGTQQASIYVREEPV
jgi:hypothetical protein